MLSDEGETEINLYPNPTNGKIKVSFTLQKDENVWFNLYDSQGKNLQLSDYEGKKGRNVVEFDLQHYPTRAYFIDLQYNQKREIRKVMKVN
ncbi:MAG: T9SS type A sorting domain-containing protein [Arcicella sp.]|nr:T9SS type A sorting domain-containing protein [Arcicella sp.]